MNFVVPSPRETEPYNKYILITKVAEVVKMNAAWVKGNPNNLVIQVQWFRSLKKPSLPYWKQRFTK